MEDILLSEEPLVSYDKVFLKAMERNNITSLKQLLEIKDEELNLQHIALKNVQRIRGLIGLLKYKYNNKDMLVSPILDRQICIDSSAELKNISENEICRLGFFSEDMNYFRRFNFYLIRNEDQFSMKFINYLRKYLAYDKKSKLSNNNSVKRISTKIELYLEYKEKYEKCYNIELLKANLKYLLDKRDMLNNQLNNIQNNLIKVNEEIINLESKIDEESRKNI